MTRNPFLTDRNQDQLDDFLGNLLDDFQAGVITKEQAAGSLNHVITALDIGNHGEVQSWLEQGRKLVHASK